MNGNLERLSIIWLVVEPCAEVIVSAAVPVNFGRRRCVAGRKKSIPDKISFSPQNFLMTIFSYRKLLQNKYAATTTSAARRQFISGGAQINKSRQQIFGGGARRIALVRS